MVALEAVLAWLRSISLLWYDYGRANDKQQALNVALASSLYRSW